MTRITSETITPELVAALKAASALSWHGIHGLAHWQRVRENGLRLASANGSDPVVIELFAFITLSPLVLVESYLLLWGEVTPYVVLIVVTGVNHTQAHRCRPGSVYQKLEPAL